MARARICDRCNKTITGNDEYYMFNTYKYFIKTNGKSWCPDLEFELCIECINDLKDFIKNNEEE